MIEKQRYLNLYYRFQLVGKLFTDPGSVEFSFLYDEKWILDGFPLSPKLPLSGHFSNTDITYFFQNLLPEGVNLDEITRLLNISKSEKFEILRQIGEDVAGAFILTTEQSILDDTIFDRPLKHKELSERLALREQRNFSVWDGKIRVSSAGFQDKIGIKVIGSEWYLPEGTFNHTSHILKPPPVNSQFESMVVNEFFCMQLAQNIGLPTAKTTIVEVPEPILLVERFDRDLQENGFYSKKHIIDGCQLLGLPTSYKMERPYGSTRDVSHIRDGASIEKLSQAITQYSSLPVIDLRIFLEWIAFQLCIGNVDAHAKNLSFFIDRKGKIRLAPFYDQICILDLEQSNENVNLDSNTLDTDLALAIGDEFTITEIAPYDIALMAKEAGFPVKAVTTAFNKTAKLVLQHLDNVAIKDTYQRFESIKNIIRKLSKRLIDITSNVEQAYKDI